VKNTKQRLNEHTLTPEEPVEAVVVTFNSEAYIRVCLDSIEKNGAKPIVVDNGSLDGTLNILRQEYPEVPVLKNPGNGYSRALNIGLSHTKGEFVILSNVDVIFPEGSISPMVQYLSKYPEVGVVGPQQLTPDHRWQRSYGDIPGPWEGVKDLLGITSIHNGVRRILWPWRIDRHPRLVPYLSGAILGVRRASVASIGGFDERFTFYAEEVKFCWQLKEAGWRIVFMPDAEVIHFGGSSSTRIDEKREAFYRLLIQAKMRLALEVCSHRKTLLYCVLEQIHCRKTAAFYRALCYLMPKSTTANFARRRDAFACVANIWREELESLREQSAPKAARLGE
jgi:hypothetical protein